MDSYIYALNLKDGSKQISNQNIAQIIQQIKILDDESDLILMVGIF